MCKGTEEEFIMNLLSIMTRKIPGNIIYLFAPKEVKEIIHRMIMSFEIINVGYLLRSSLFLIELPH